MPLQRTCSAWLSALTSFTFAMALWASPASVMAQTGAAASVATRLTQPVDESQLVTLKGTVHRLATAANDRGAVDQGLALDRVQVMLKRSPAQETALRQLIQGMHQPGSASYHQWLTPAQFGAQFGPSDADIATLTSWLGSHGFSVTKVNPGKQTLEIAGSAGQFEKTFHASIHKYQVNGQMHYANAGDPSIPAALAPVFGGFAPLNNFPLKSYEKVLGRASYNPATKRAKSEWTVGSPSTGYNFLLAPGDFAVQYDLNPLYTAGTTGAGQTIGIINEANISIPLVNQYRTLFGLTANPPNVIIDGNDPGIDGVNNPDGSNGASGEAYLDVELAGAVAPAATVDLIIAGDTALSSGLELAAQHAVYGNVAPVLSISFGSCEAAGGSSFWDSLWEQAAAQGQTVMVSSGDAGSAGCDDDNVQQFAVYGQEVNGIASTPWNVAVGGTDFYYSSYNGSGSAQNAQLAQYWGDPTATASDTTPTTTLLSRVPEQPWNDSQFGLNLFNLYANGDGTSIAGGGGGASNCATGVYGSTTTPCAGYPKPTWQAGTGVPADGVRDIPDVSLFAANGLNFTYYPICAADGDCQPVSTGEVQITGVGGTSASSPAFAGIMALVNQKYGPQGQANFVLYPLATQYPAAFNDVTVGTNSVPCSLQTVTSQGNNYPADDCLTTTSSYTATDPIYGTSTEGQIGNTTTKVPEYNAGVGYDLGSGLGTIDASNLVANWANVKFASSSVTLGSSQTTFAHGTAVTISGAVTPGTAAGLVSLETTSSQPLQAGQTNFTVGANGAYSGSVNFLPGGTYEIYGTYSGDGINGPSSSGKTSITVTPEASATGLQVYQSAGNSIKSGSTVPYGTQLLLEGEPGSVTAGSTTTVPTGSVTYLSGTTSLGSAAVNAQGTSELNYVPVPSATPYSVTAQYSGDASYNASTSAATMFTVTKNTPSVLLGTGTGSLSVVSGTTALTVGVENSSNAAAENSTGYALANSAVAPTGVVTVTGLPGGTLTFPALSSFVNPTNLFVEGVANLPLPAETAGTYSVTVSYPGDTNYNAASATASVTIAASTGIATTTTAQATAATSVSTTPTLTFLVMGTPAGGALTGTVTLYASGVELTSITIPTGATDTFGETLSLNGALATGANQITVQYSGNTVYAPSFATATVQNGGATTVTTPAVTLSNSGAITVVAGATTGNTSTIAVTPSGGFVGAVALTCAVAPTTGTSVPTCTVTGSPLTITGAAAGSATVTITTTSTTTAGAYAVTVSGTATGATVAATTVSLTVTAPVMATPAVTLGGGTSITIATAGGSGTSAISVTPAGGFSGSVTLACAVSAAASDTPTCSLSGPVTIAAGSTTPGSATLTVNTTAASAAMEMPRMRMLPIGGGIAAATLLFFLVPMKRRRISTLLGALVLIAMVGLSTGCGGGGSSPTGGGNTGTPAGTYMVTVSGTASGVTITPITVSVTVQ